ncbi:MAG: tRNA pseudouridine(54/55) synthase Pus10 [Desulfurococcaceae archaeon]
MNSENIVVTVLSKARSVLKKYPLCDHCLGRLFARLGVGLGNDTRGFSIKTMLQLVIHHEKSTSTDQNEIRELAVNAGEPFITMYRIISGETVCRKPCYICNNKLSREYFQSIAEKAYRILKDWSIERFLVGVTLPREIRLRELEVLQITGFEWAESIKNEVKREVGKIIRDKYGLIPDFDNPEAVVIIDFDKDNLDIQPSPIYIEGVYWKKARMISQTDWINNNVSKCPLSLESFLNENLREVFGSEKIFIHASGREDVDVRMIGSGRPVVIEAYKPSKRRFDLNDINNRLNTDIVEFKLTSIVKRSRVVYLKTTSGSRRKTYKALIYSSKELSNNDMVKLEEFYKTNNVVKQWTPTRVLYRRRDTLRIRKVFEVKTKLLSSNVFEAIIKCDGGLYVKELIHGDNGRTQPSFSEIIGAVLIPLELDVISVE